MPQHDAIVKPAMIHDHTSQVSGKGQPILLLLTLLVGLIHGFPHLLIPQLLPPGQLYTPLPATELGTYDAAVREVYDGRIWVGDLALYEYKGQPLPSGFAGLPPLMLGLLARVTGSIANIFALTNFLGPAVAFLVLARLVLGMTNSLWTAVTTGLLVVFGTRSFLRTEYWLIETLWKARAMPAISDFLMAGVFDAELEFIRLFHPGFSFPWLALGLYGVFWSLQSPRRFPVWLAGLSLGSLFYMYLYYWTFFAAGTAILTLVLLFTKQSIWKRSMAIIAIGLLFSPPYWAQLLRFRLSPSATDVLARSGLEVGRSFDPFSIGYLLFCGIFAFVYRKRGLTFWFLISFMLGGVVCANLQVVFGASVQIEHYNHRVMAPWFLLMMAILIREVWRTHLVRWIDEQNVDIGRLPQIVALLVCLFLLSYGLYAGYLSVKREVFSPASPSPAELEAYEWLNGNTATDSVLLFPSFSTASRVLAYTHNNIFVPNGLWTLASNAEILERVEIAYSLFEMPLPSRQTLKDTNVLYYLFHQEYSDVGYWWHLPAMRREQIEAIIGRRPLPIEDVCSRLEKYRADYVFWGPSERRLVGLQPETKLPLTNVFGNDGVSIYRIDCVKAGS